MSTVKHQIGAGGRIYMATAAAPQTVSGIAARNQTSYIRGMSISSSIGTDDVTTLDADTDGFAQRFISALQNSTGSMKALFGAPTGVFLRFVDAISKANNHTTGGRGAVDVIYDPYGTVAGNLRLKFTLIFTAIPVTGELGTAVSGDFGFQVTGLVSMIDVPAQPET